MAVGNSIVRAILSSPLHGLLSRSTDVIRYRGRRTGDLHEVPTQYARSDDGIVVLVGRPETKSWWRNFREGRDAEILLRRQWTPMTGTAVVGAESPAQVVPLLETYLSRFPRAERLLDDATGEERSNRAVLVHFRRRGTESEREGGADRAG